MGKRKEKFPVAPIAPKRPPPIPDSEKSSAATAVSTGAKRQDSRKVPLAAKLPNTRDPVCRAISRKEMYMANLEMRKKPMLLTGGAAVALSSCDDSGKLLNGYVIVEVVQLADRRREETCILMCTCEENAAARERLQVWRRQSRPIDQIVNFERSELASECLHGQVVRQLFPQVVQVQVRSTDHDFADGSTFDKLQAQPLMFAVKCTAGTYSVVAKGTFRWRCQSCNREKCPHTATLKKCGDRPGFDRNDLLFNNDQDQQRSSNVKSVSQQRIAFPLRNITIPMDLPQVLVARAGGTCPHGHAWSKEEPTAGDWIRKEGARLYFLGHLGFDCRTVTVCYRPTDECDCMLEYDGGVDCVLNLNNSTLVHYGVLVKYLSSFATCGQPLDTFHQTHAKVFELCSESSGQVIGSQPLRLAWNAFMALLDMHPEKRFICSTCGPFPDTVILDGHALGVKQHLLHGLDLTLSSAGDPTQKPLKGSRHEDRVLLRAEPVRRALRRFATGEDIENGDRSAILTDPEYLDLCRALGPRTSPLRRIVEEAKEPDVNVAKGGYKTLLKECSRNTPVAGIIPLLDDTRSRQILQDIIDGSWSPCSTGSSEKLDHLLQHLPVITEALSMVNAEAGTLSVAIRDLLAQFVRIYDRTFSGPERSGRPVANDFSSKLAYFPHWPTIRALERYELDGNKKDKDEAGICTKKKLSHPVLSAGVIAYVCNHGVCYGYTIMDSPESPRMPFAVFWTRWPKPPKRIVYDNCCRLHIYALNREPKFFQSVHFLVDRFHIVGHTGCSASYNMSKYPANNEISTTNSQFCEQFNSILIKLKPSLSYMTLVRFKSSLTLFIGIRKFLFPSKLTD